ELIRIRRPGDAKIDHLRLALRIDEDISGLKIAVNDSLGMSVLNCVADFGQQSEPRRRREVLPLRIARDRHSAGDELHRVVRNTCAGVFMRAGLEDLRDSGMSQPRQQMRFKLKPPLLSRRLPGGAQKL